MGYLRILLICTAMICMHAGAGFANCGKGDCSRCSAPESCASCQPCNSCETSKCVQNNCGNSSSCAEIKGKEVLSLNERFKYDAVTQLVNGDCCPPDEFRLLCKQQYCGYTICCERSNFELLCRKPEVPACDKCSVKKCRQKTCRPCEDEVKATCSCR